jgi:endonuclease/exonuclease/phosphatase family metal-dependent hydrolase
LSYNLFIRPPGIKNNSNDYKDERLNEFIKIMDRFDVIGLQEIFAAFSSRQQTLIDAAYEKGFLYHLKSPLLNPLSTFLVDGKL